MGTEETNKIFERWIVQAHQFDVKPLIMVGLHEHEDDGEVVTIITIQIDKAVRPEEVTADELTRYWSALITAAAQVYKELEKHEAREGVEEWTD